MKLQLGMEPIMRLHCVGLANKQDIIKLLSRKLINNLLVLVKLLDNNKITKGYNHMHIHYCLIYNTNSNRPESDKACN